MRQWMCPAAQTQRLVYDIKVEVRWSLSAFTSSVCVLRFLKQDVFLTLSLSFSFSLSIALFSPSSSRSISLTVSPDRVLNFFLRNKSSERGEEEEVESVASTSQNRTSPAGSEARRSVDSNYHDNKRLDYFLLPTPRGDTFCTIKQIRWALQAEHEPKT